jgi:hypothetical protein
MASEKAWYWLAAGVLALGLNGAYQDGQFGWVHGLVNHSTEVVEDASIRGLGIMASVEGLFGTTPARPAWMETTLHRMQGKLACKRMEMAERQIDMAVLQKDLAQARVERQLARVQMKMDKVREIAIERANRTGRCSGISRMVMTAPGAGFSNSVEIEMPEMPAMPEVQVPSATHDPI